MSEVADTASALKTIDSLAVDVARMPRPRCVALDQQLEWRTAVHLHEARRQRREPRLDFAAAHEVGLEHEARACLDALLGERKHDAEGRRAEPLRPGEVARAEPVEERLLDRVLRDQRQVEPRCELARDRRLPRRRRPRYDHQPRRLHQAGLRGKKAAEDVLEDAAVAEVLPLARRV